MAANFDKYLDIPVESIERPSPPPEGHYYASIVSYKQAERDYGKADGRPKSPVMEITFKLASAFDDVNPDFLPEGGIAGRLVQKDYQLDDQIGQSQLRQLGEDLCDLDVKGLRLRDLLAQLPGQEVKLYMSTRDDKTDPDIKWPVVKKVLKAA